jgi:hypothetical protein
MMAGGDCLNYDFYDQMIFMIFDCREKWRLKPQLQKPQGRPSPTQYRL